MERYKQQLILREIGIEGQQKISKASILIIGAGGLGSIVSGFLGSMGVGRIGICDFDTIEVSNLHRQLFYLPGDVHLSKAEVLKSRLSLQNPTIQINSINEKFQHTNSQSIISNFDIVCDCSDNVHTRILINKSCTSQSKPLIHGAVSEWQGYVTVFHYKRAFSLTDIFDTLDLIKSDSCEQNGINSTICGIIGSHMANEVIKVILGLDQVLDGRLFYINALTNVTKYLNLKRKEK